MVTIASKLSARWTHVPKVKMRPCHWKKIPDPNLEKSVWASTKNITGRLNLSELETNFSGTDTAASERLLQGPKNIQKSLIDSKKAQNIGEISQQITHFVMYSPSHILFCL
jgi:hypothetical protein